MAHLQPLEDAAQWGLDQAERTGMRTKVRDTGIYIDFEGAGQVPNGAAMRERPKALVIHVGPGADHSGSKPALSPLAEHMQLVYFDHCGHGRSARGDPAPVRLERSGDKRVDHLGFPQTYPPSLWVSAAATCRDRPH